jgi:rhodanese-related sulfurtransferase
VADLAFDELLTGLCDAPLAVELGRALSPVGRGLERCGVVIDLVGGDWPSIQLERRYDLAVVTVVEPADAVAAVHCAVQHLVPAGRLVVVGDDPDGLAARFDLVASSSAASEGGRVTVFRRTERRTIHDAVFEARARLDRTTAAELAARMAGPNAPTIVDTRTATDRQRFGVIQGSIHVPRTVLEWHLDPANGYRHPAVRSLQQPLVVVCNGGYSSALAAASLLDLGFTDVSDLVGGVRTWIAEGQPVVEPDHCHLDL